MRRLSSLAAALLLPGTAFADWSGVQGRNTVTQTADDIVVREAGARAPAFSARNFAADQYALLSKEYEQPPPGPGGASKLWVRHRFQFVSLAGPYLALRDEAEVEVGHAAIPGGRAQFWTIDLRRGTRYGFDEDDPLGPSATSPGAIVDLRRLVPETAIAKAISGTPLARTAPVPASPGYRETMYALSRVGRAGKNCFEASLAATSSFAITAADPGVLDVELGLPGQSSCRIALTVLALRIPLHTRPPGLDRVLLPPAGLPPAIVQQGTPPS